MEVSFLFNSDAEEFGGFYGLPVQKKILSTNILQNTNRHMRVSVGDLSTMDMLRNGDNPDVVFNKLFNAQFSHLKKDKIKYLLNRATLYVWLIQNITEKTSKELGNKLWGDETFLGFHQVDFTYPLHYRFYYQSISEQLRIYGKTASIFEQIGITNPDRDETLVSELENLGFKKVSFEDIGIRGTVLDQYNKIDHFQRRASFLKTISSGLPGGHDEASNLSSFLDEIHPKLFEILASAIKAIENTETTEDVAQAALSCRRFLSTISDILFPPTKQLRNGRMVDANKYKNRLCAYIEEALNIKNEINKEKLMKLGNEIDRLANLFNKGVHTECSRDEIFQGLVDLSTLISSIIAINPDLTRRPYATLVPSE